jgi:hypothetical protein
MRTLATQRFASLLTRLLFVAVLALGTASISQGSVFVSVAIAPPPIPVYAQPICPGPGYLWVPGYWAYGPVGYYWVPGYWVLPPFVGALWTPGYWGWVNGAYTWHAGYWGSHVGFYGGINYGFGYFGVGYVGGDWRGGTFYYNTAVTNVNVSTVNYVYNQRVVQATTTRVSFNGGPGGISRQPTTQERLAQRDTHRSATPIQLQQEHLARADRSQWSSVNHGKPSVMATSKAAAFAGRGGGQSVAPSTAASSAPARRELRAQSARSETHTQAAPPVNREARAEHRAAPPVASARSEARAEQHAPAPHAAAPMARSERQARVASRPEVHAQGAPRTEMRAAPRAPRPEKQEARAPRPEMHAQNAPRMQAPSGAPRGESRGGPRGGEDRRGTENRG